MTAVMDLGLLNFGLVWKLGAVMLVYVALVMFQFWLGMHDRVMFISNRFIGAF